MGYEFSKEEEKVFFSVGNKLIIIGIGVMVWSFIELNIIKSEPLRLNFLVPILQIIIGFMLFYPSAHLRKIKTTSGQDIEELMNSISKMTVSFTVFLGLNVCILVIQMVSGGVLS